MLRTDKIMSIKSYEKSSNNMRIKLYFENKNNIIRRTLYKNDNKFLKNRLLQTQKMSMFFSRKFKISYFFSRKFSTYGVKKCPKFFLEHCWDWSQNFLFFWQKGTPFFPRLSTVVLLRHCTRTARITLVSYQTYQKKCFPCSFEKNTKLDPAEKPPHPNKNTSYQNPPQKTRLFSNLVCFH